MHATRTITAIWVNSEPAEAGKPSEEAKAASRRFADIGRRQKNSDHSRGSEGPCHAHYALRRGLGMGSQGGLLGLRRNRQDSNMMAGLIFHRPRAPSLGVAAFTTIPAEWLKQLSFFSVGLRGRQHS
jgi:hypothetical protein